MCGIFGAIGKSKDPKVTFDLLNSIFLKTEVRGTDASGFYGTEPEEGSIVYDKEPLKSSEYIRQDIWKKTFAGTEVDLFIGHCRQTSANVGSEKVNKNNHPHLSSDRRVAMVHNGKIPEFSALRGRYDVESECDSEILLRMFESAQTFTSKEEELKKEFPTLTPFLAYRLAGLKEIFARVNYGAMAVAIAERGDDGSRYLWLFRDDERPLNVVDMRKTLGQIFFCSTPDIWRNAVEATPSAKQYIPQDQVIIEFPALQIWLLSLDKQHDGPTKPWHIRKFKITKTRYIDHDPESNEDDKLSFKRPAGEKPKPVVAKVVTRLAGNDELVQKAEPETKPARDKKKVSLCGPAQPSVLAGASTDGLITSGVHDLDPDVARDPGDETETDTWDEDVVLVPGTTETILTKQDLESAAAPAKKEEVNLDMFDKKLDELGQKFQKMRSRVHELGKSNQLGGRELSQVIDSLVTIDVEVGQAMNLLNNSGASGG